jgi:REP element-mobilizing transposase RayT
MARKVRVEYSSAVYHFMNRGDGCEPSFRDEADRQGFVATWAEACGRTGWLVHACEQMAEHFHLVVEIPQPNLIALSANGQAG